MTGEYIPTWQQEPDSDYESAEDYPDDFAHALDTSDPPEWEPTELGTDEEPTQDYIGEKRHIGLTFVVPRVWTATPDEWVAHLCGSQYRFSVWFDGTPDAVIDADRTGGEIDMTVWGPREGDMSSIPVTVDEISPAAQGGVRVEFTSSTATDETLERIIEQGCLLCQEDGQ